MNVEGLENFVGSTVQQMYVLKETYLANYAFGLSTMGRIISRSDPSGADEIHELLYKGIDAHVEVTDKERDKFIQRALAYIASEAKRSEIQRKGLEAARDYWVESLKASGTKMEVVTLGARRLAQFNAQLELLEGQ